MDGHLPGAVFADLDTELSAPPSAEHGRHPLPRTGRPAGEPPAAGDFATARPWSFTTTTAGKCRPGVVAAALGRGHATSGSSMVGWPHGWPMGPNWPPVPDHAEPGDVVLIAPGTCRPSVPPTRRVAGRRARRALDARAGERYRGEVEPLDSRPGHVPGAISLPTSRQPRHGRPIPGRGRAPRAVRRSRRGRTRSPCIAARASPRRTSRALADRRHRRGPLPGVLVGLVGRPRSSGRDRPATGLSRELAGQVSQLAGRVSSQGPVSSRRRCGREPGAVAARARARRDRRASGPP